MEPIVRTPDRARAVTRLGLLAALLSVAFACDGRPQGLAAGKNVLVVTVDTTRADAISCLGGDPRTTPHIDGLAARSTLFTQAMSETNTTNPSHVSIFSGLRLSHHGALSNAVSMRPGVDTLQEAFGRVDYQTAGFVAAPHLQEVPGWKGFDEFPVAEQVLDASSITERALGWLEDRDSGRPFFLWAHYFDPHGPYEPGPEDAAMFYPGDPTAGDDPPIGSRWEGEVRRKWLMESYGLIRDPAWPAAMYAAKVHAMDREIGRLLEGLTRLGLEADTVVVLLADHGESLGEHDIWYAHKGLFETQLRIPMMIHVPGLAPGRSDAMASTIDIAPTLEELLGVELRGDPDGLSLVQELTGQGSLALRERTSFVHQSPSSFQVALREEGWKLMWPLGPLKEPLTTTPQLFDLRQDPDELRDLYESDPARAAAMRRVLEPWLEMAPLEQGDTPELSEEMMRELRQLGYADHIGG